MDSSENGRHTIRCAIMTYFLSLWRISFAGTLVAYSKVNSETKVKGFRTNNKFNNLIIGDYDYVTNS